VLYSACSIRNTETGELACTSYHRVLHPKTQILPDGPLRVIEIVVSARDSLLTHTLFCSEGGSAVTRVIHAMTLWVSLTAMLSGAAVAQTTKGTISGQASDTSGAVLQGSQVQLLPVGIKVASDALGKFVFTDLAAGEYKVVISYLGFKPFEANVNLRDGENQYVDAHLVLLR